MGAGGAITGGVVKAAEVVVVVVVAVSVPDAVGGASVAQDAVKPASATIARPPATAESRRVIRCDSM